MTQEVFHGAATREPVYSGGRRVRGLWQRRLADGSTVFEARLRKNVTKDGQTIDRLLYAYVV